jgi:hypothetical protein
LLAHDSSVISAQVRGVGGESVQLVAVPMIIKSKTAANVELKQPALQVVQTEENVQVTLAVLLLTKISTILDALLSINLQFVKLVGIVAPEVI